jgi:hypothetical protein
LRSSTTIAPSCTERRGLVHLQPTSFFTRSCWAAHEHDDDWGGQVPPSRCGVAASRTTIGIGERRSPTLPLPEILSRSRRSGAKPQHAQVAALRNSLADASQKRRKR